MKEKHPIQPVTGVSGVIRFKENKIVTYLLDNGGLDLNDIARKPFDRDDRNQFAQLIGYSLDGFASLSYASSDTIDTADEMAKGGGQSGDAELKVLRGKLDNVRRALKPLILELFKIHEDDIVS